MSPRSQHSCRTRIHRRQATLARVLWRQRPSLHVPLQDAVPWLIRSIIAVRRSAPSGARQQLRQAIHATLQVLPSNVLLQLVGDRRRVVRHSVIAALCYSHVEPVPIALIWHGLTDRDERFAIAMLLADVPETFPLVGLRELLVYDADEHIRLCALAALGQLGSDCPAEAIAQGLVDPDPLVRLLARDIAGEQQLHVTASTVHL